MNSIQVSARIGAMIVQAAAAQGVDVASLCADTGFDPASATDPDARIAFDLEEALWREGARRTGDDAFGLHAAEGLKPGAFDVVDYAVRTAPTARAAFERLARYNVLVHDVARFTLIDRGTTTRIEHAFANGGGQHRHSAEFTLAAMVTIGVQLTRVPFVARAVSFPHAQPASVDEHVRIFGVAPRFSQPGNAIEFESDLIAQPCPAADPMLWQVIQRHAEHLLSARPDPMATTKDRVRRLLSGVLGEGDATLARVASDLHMSERSLQRRLADEGITFDALLDDLRRELALRYLSDPTIGIAEVAYLLGYSEPSPFHRAFKRWTGATPTQVRRRAA